MKKAQFQPETPDITSDPALRTPPVPWESIYPGKGRPETVAHLDAVEGPFGGLVLLLGRKPSMGSPTHPADLWRYLRPRSPGSPSTAFAESATSAEFAHVYYLSYFAADPTGVVVTNVSSPKESAPPQDPNDLDAAIHLLCNSADPESFENGMDNEFSLGIESAIERGGDDVILGFLAELCRPDRPPSVIAEALRTIGQVARWRAPNAGLHLLQSFLAHPSAIVRDAAVLGLVSLRDERALNLIQSAIARESSPRLREAMQGAYEALRGYWSGPSRKKTE